MFWHSAPTVSHQLSVHVFETGGHRLAGRNREAESHSLVDIMIGVLAKDYNLDIIKRAAVESPAQALLVDYCRCQPCTYCKPVRADVSVSLGQGI